MKRSAAVVIFGAICVGALWGRSPWIGGSTGPIYYNRGNVGIGTASPAVALHVFGQIQIDGTQSTRLQSAVNGADYGTVGMRDSGGPNYNIYREVPADNASANVLIPAGNVGIGTTNPTYALPVNGTIEAKEVLVQAGWPDYEFSPEYRLPGIPPEVEVKEKGVSMGDMQSKLAKVEKSALHMIEADNRLEQDVKCLQGRLGKSDTGQRAPANESAGGACGGNVVKGIAQ